MSLHSIESDNKCRDNSPIKLTSLDLIFKEDINILISILYI